MARTNNYLTQAALARERFLTYDQDALIRKLKLPFDEEYLYVTMLSRRYRIHRTTGDLEKEADGIWQDANTYNEVMTLLDLLCDSREDRFLRHRWKDMQNFGLMFHRNLLESPRDPWAHKFEAQPEAFRNACLALGGEALPTGDICYAIELFDGLRIAVQLWFGDEEFPPNLRMMWDENALMYIKYETMYFARAMLLQRLEEEMV